MRFSEVQKRRLAAKAKTIGLGRLKALAQVASPQTLLKWYRDLIARKYDGGPNRGPGRPSTAAELKEVVLRLAKENRGWGYPQIQGALAHLGHEIGRTTIREILLGAGLAPAPERRRGKPWKEFLRAYWQELSAVDFFAVAVLSLGGLQRYWVMVVMEWCPRRVTIAGIPVEPTGAWVEPVARGLADGFGGVLAGQRYLIHDRGAVFTEKFRSLLAAVDVETLKLPARAPNLNAHLERWIRGIREECLDHLILFSEASLRKVVGDYVAHFHRERPHQGLENEIIEPEFEPRNRAGQIQCRKRLGGLLKYYYREAA